jgi:hypothetical protein
MGIVNDKEILMTVDTIVTIFVMACGGFAIFNLGQAYALIRETRLENERHIETLREIQKRRG